MLKPLFVLPAVLLFSFLPQQPAAPPASAEIPADAARMTNPIKPTPESQAQAKRMYGYDCAMCHGAAGDGKGDLAADMKPPLKDYTDPAVLKGLSDGEIFYIIKNGRGQMPGEGDRMNANGLWNMVLFLRSLAKQ